MQTFNRICIKTTDFIDGERSLTLERGKEYLTSAERDGKVTVFSSYWATVPVNLFAAEIEFTKGEG